MPRNMLDSWMDLILQTPLPAGSSSHCWLGLPVRFHWITLAPDSLLSPAISRTKPEWTLWMRYPLSCFTHFHLWLNLRFISYWMMRSPGQILAAGTSKAFPESLLMRTKLVLMVGFNFTSSSLQRWLSELGSKGPYFSEPSRQTLLSPLALVLIQQQVKNPGKPDLTMANSWLDFCLPNSSRTSFPSSLSTNPVFRLTNSKSSTFLPTRSMKKSWESSAGLQGTPTKRDSSYFLGSVSLGLSAKSTALLMSAQTAPFLKVGTSSIRYDSGIITHHQFSLNFDLLGVSNRCAINVHRNHPESLSIFLQPIDYTTHKVQFEFAAGIVQIFHDFFIDFNGKAAALRAACKLAQLLLLATHGESSKQEVEFLDIAAAGLHTSFWLNDQVAFTETWKAV